MVYIIAFSVVFYQARSSALDNEVNFGAALLEVYMLFLGDWDSDSYDSVTMPFFIIVTVALTLIMLNMIIAIMGDTFSRVQENLSCNMMPRKSCP